MNKNKVKEIELGEHYLISKSLENIDFIDHYQLSTTKLNYAPEPKDLMIAFFKSFPKSFVFLLLLREKIASIFNLKTADRLDEQSRIEKLHNFKGKYWRQYRNFSCFRKKRRRTLNRRG